MNFLHFSENLIRLRHEKKITQEELADFIGVTKASVSKWENRQSLPDILLLPHLAAFFGVTIDELIGYEPQLSKEQIRKIYMELCEDFSALPFLEVMKKSRLLVHQYYSCYPFLLQTCLLWLNHFMLAETNIQQAEILQDISALCSHIIQNCKNIGISGEAVSLKAMADLQLGKAEEVVDTLENITNPHHISNQNDALLVQAYQAAGDLEKARNYTQLSMYLHLLSLVGSAVSYLSIQIQHRQICEETICRIDRLIESYDLAHLHPNVAAQFYYQAALVYMVHGERELALDRLAQYRNTVCFLLSNQNIYLHGDSYFDSIENWFEGLDLGPNPPRNKKIVAEGACQAFLHPLFAQLENNTRFQQIKKSLQEGASHYE